MKLITKLLFLNLFSFYVNAQTANIEQLSDCWDIREQVTAEDRAKSFVNWLRSKNFKDYDSAQAFCNALGFQVQDLLARFQFESNQSGWGKLQMEMDLFSSNYYEFKDRFTWYVEGITPSVKDIFDGSFKGGNNSSYVMYTGDPFKFIMVNRDINRGYTEAVIKRKDSSAFTINNQANNITTNKPSVLIPAINPLPMPDPQIMTDSLSIQQGSPVTVTCIVRNGQVGELNPMGLWICGTRNLTFRPLTTTKYELTIYGSNNTVFSKAVTVTVAKK